MSLTQIKQTPKSFFQSLKTLKSLSSPKAQSGLVVTCLIFLAFALIRILRIDVPIFDEALYVEAAVKLVTLESVGNWEHPPFAKYFMGIFELALPQFGARISSVIAGLLQLWLLIRIADRALVSRFWVLLFFCLETPLLLFSSIAMLEAYVFLFFALITYQLQTLAIEKKPNPRSIALLGVTMGLAIATKWSTLPLALASACVLGFWFRNLRFVLIFSAMAVFSYSACFVPYFFLKSDAPTVADLFKLQTQMLNYHLSYAGKEPYLSPWWSWPWMKRPIWLHLETQGDQVIGLFSIGNFAVHFFAWVAIAREWRVLIQSRLNQFLIFFMGVWFLFFAISQKPAQHAYYYVMLSPCLLLLLSQTKWRKPAAILGIVFLLVLSPVLLGLPISRAWFDFLTWPMEWNFFHLIPEAPYP